MCVNSADCGSGRRPIVCNASVFCGYCDIGSQQPFSVVLQASSTLFISQHHPDLFDQTSRCSRSSSVSIRQRLPCPNFGKNKLPSTSRAFLRMTGRFCGAAPRAISSPAHGKSWQNPQSQRVRLTPRDDNDTSNDVAMDDTSTGQPDAPSTASADQADTRVRSDQPPSRVRRVYVAPKSAEPFTWGLPSLHGGVRQRPGHLHNLWIRASSC